MILLGQQGNWDMLSVVLEIDLFPLQRSQLGAFVDVHFGRLLPGRFPLQPYPACKGPKMSLQMSSQREEA